MENPILVAMSKKILELKAVIEKMEHKDEIKTRALTRVRNHNDENRWEKNALKNKLKKIEGRYLNREGTYYIKCLETEKRQSYELFTYTIIGSWLSFAIIINLLI